MTENDLVDKLNEMLATTTRGVDITATVLLFGVLFDEEIRDSNSNASRIANAVGKKCQADITDGQKFSQLKFVEPTAAMTRRWKRDLYDQR